MATITDYDSLVAAIARKLVNSDLTAKADEFIRSAEDAFNLDLHNLEMEETATTLTVAGDPTLALPTDFRQIRSIYLETDPVTLLTYMTPDQLRTYWAASATAQPQNYSIISEQIVLRPTPDGTYSANLSYVRTLVALSSTNTSNWLLEKYPSVYLYGALVHAEVDGWNDERAAGTFKPYVDEMIAKINAEGLRRRLGPGLRMRPPVLERI